MSKPSPADGYERCGAEKRSGGPCGLPAGHGTKHVGIGRCRRHGGNTPAHVAAAQRQEAEAAVVTYGLPREVDAHTALLEELHRTAGHVAWLSTVVRELEQEQLYGEVGGGLHSAPSVEPHIFLVLYTQERKHLRDIAKTCVDVGIEERRVQLAETQGALIAQVLRGVLADLGVANHPKAAEVVRRHLTLVSSAGQAA